MKTRCFSLIKGALTKRENGKGKSFIGIKTEKTLVIKPVPVAAGGGPNVPIMPGVRVCEVLLETPAEKAGVKVGDVIIAVDDLDFSKLTIEECRAKSECAEFNAYIQSKDPGDVITLHLRSKGEEVDKEVTLIRRSAFVGNNEYRQAQLSFEKWLKEMGK